jgi:hypothetical protein
MSETYVSLGTSASLLFAYIGGLLVVLGAALSWHQRKGPESPRKRTQALTIAICAVILIICGLFELPMILYFVALLLVALFFMLRNQPPTKPITRILWTIVGLSVVILDGWSESDQRITLTNDVVTTTPAGIFAHRSDFKGSANKSDLHVSETTSQMPILFSSKPWVDWHIYSGKLSKEGGIYTHSNKWYWGPHGFITANQVASRIAGWAGVTPTVTKQQ